MIVIRFPLMGDTFFHRKQVSFWCHNKISVRFSNAGNFCRTVFVSFLICGSCQKKTWMPNGRCGSSQGWQCASFLVTSNLFSQVFFWQSCQMTFFGLRISPPPGKLSANAASFLMSLVFIAIPRQKNPSKCKGDSWGTIRNCIKTISCKCETND